jgi:hypothetical protein
LDRPLPQVGPQSRGDPVLCARLLRARRSHDPRQTDRPSFMKQGLTAHLPTIRTCATSSPYMNTSTAIPARGWKRCIRPVGRAWWRSFSNPDASPPRRRPTPSRREGWKHAVDESCVTCRQPAVRRHGRRRSECTQLGGGHRRCYGHAKFLSSTKLAGPGVPFMESRQIRSRRRTKTPATWGTITPVTRSEPDDMIA